MIEALQENEKEEQKYHVDKEGVFNEWKMDHIIIKIFE